MNNLVSIIIPCFNQGAFIRETIESVKSQTYNDWEIIIVNDGSNDADTLKELDILKVEGFNIINSLNCGVSAARNKGIAAAKGDFVLPLDADDKISPEYLQEAIKVLLEKPEVKLVYCDCEYFGTLTGLSQVPPFTLKGMLKENLIFNAALLRKASVIEAGGYDETFLAGWEDWELWLRYIKTEAEVYKLPHTYFYYRIKEDSRNSSIKNERLQICEQQLYKKHIDLYLNQNPKPISAIKNYTFYKNEYEKLEDYKHKLHLSLSYRIGNFILAPLKWIKGLLKNES